MKPASRPGIFKGRQSDPQLILCAVRGYLRSALPFREVAARLRTPTQKSWRVDETTVRVKGRWCYLYRAIDATGTPIDFMLSGVPDAAAATRLFRTALSDPSATAAGHPHAGRGGRRRRRAAEATHRPPAAL